MDKYSDGVLAVSRVNDCLKKNVDGFVCVESTELLLSVTAGYIFNLEAMKVTSINPSTGEPVGLQEYMKIEIVKFLFENCDPFDYEDLRNDPVFISNIDHDYCINQSLPGQDHDYFIRLKIDQGQNSDSFILTPSHPDYYSAYDKAYTQAVLGYYLKGANEENPAAGLDWFHPGDEAELVLIKAHLRDDHLLELTLPYGNLHVRNIETVSGGIIINEEDLGGGTNFEPEVSHATRYDAATGSIHVAIANQGEIRCDYEVGFFILPYGVRHIPPRRTNLGPAVWREDGSGVDMESAEFDFDIRDENGVVTPGEYWIMLSGPTGRIYEKQIITVP